MYANTLEGTIPKELAKLAKLRKCWIFARVSFLQWLRYEWIFLGIVPLQ